jgi:endonuclease I
MIRTPFSIVYFLFLFCSCLLHGQPAYYSSIDFSQTGDDLKAQLSELITNTHTAFIPYTAQSTDTWDILSISDLEFSTSDNVLLVYGYDNNDGMFISDRLRGVFEKCNFSGCTGTAGLWNREHVFAKSLANPSLETNFPGPGTDVHNLRAADSQKNTQRSNRLFIDDSGVDSRIINGDYFYPGDEWKGDVARIIMYMYLRYPSQCEAVNSATGSANYSPNGDMPDVFLEWNEEDPVSALELTRNDVISSYQGNRNPFIDNPYFATLIWNGPAANDSWGTLLLPVYDEVLVSVSPTITNRYIEITGLGESDFNVTIYSHLGHELASFRRSKTIDVSSFSSGLYIVHVVHPKGTSQVKFMVR